jgi:hypothetical protein
VTGFTDKKAKRPPNVALAAKKARKAADKTGGRKKPRIKDLDQKVRKVGAEAQKVNQIEDDESLHSSVGALSNVQTEDDESLHASVSALSNQDQTEGDGSLHASVSALSNKDPIELEGHELLDEIEIR